MRRRFIMSAALAAALTLPGLAYGANQDPAYGEGGTGTAGTGGNLNKMHHHAAAGAETKHTMNHTSSPPASGGSAGAPGGGGCDPAATASSASAPVGQAAPGCK